MKFYQSLSSQNLYLVKQFTKRDLQAKYHGTWLGIGWFVLTPLLLLGAFTLVFYGIFNMKWPHSQWDSPLGFAIFTFCGLLMHQTLADTTSRAPMSILSQSNLVTKVSFPLWVLPISITLSSFIQLLISLCVFLVILFFVNDSYLTWLVLPMLLLPFMLALIGASLLLSALGFYFRDLNQIMVLFLTLMMFLTPIFYPISSIPPDLAVWLSLNPMSTLIESVRQVLILGEWPSIVNLGVLWFWAMLFMVSGIFLYVRLNKGFADVI